MEARPTASLDGLDNASVRLGSMPKQVSPGSRAREMRTCRKLICHRKPITLSALLLCLAHTGAALWLVRPQSRPQINASFDNADQTGDDAPGRACRNTAAELDGRVRA